MRRLSFAVAVVVLLVGPLSARPHVPPPDKEVAFTFDDLPLITEEDPDETLQVATDRILATLVREHVPAIGFVNERKLLGEDDQPDPDRVRLLEQWLDAGFDLGNHTWGHVDLHEVPVAEYESEILRGEQVTRELMAKRGKQPRWFRHPYLDTGKSLEVRHEVEKFLADHGYRVAPVTVDNSEWIFALAYHEAIARHQFFRRRRIGKEYIRYMERRFEWYEEKSKLVFGRQIRQTLLLHADMLNADMLPALIDMLRRRGYRFISLDEAMQDRAYSSPDHWILPGGVSWIERWGVTKGIHESVFDADPRVPLWIDEEAGVKEE